MPRGAAPGWKQRKPPVLDDWILASISGAGGRPGTDGHYAERHIAGLGSREEAREYVRALHRCGRWLTRWTQYDIGVRAHILKQGDRYRVQFWAVDKTAARQHVLTTYGTDRSYWPYDPRRRGTPTDA
jgi:hypothetical protein